MNNQETGWSAESKLLQLISKELTKLEGTIGSVTSGGSGGSSDGVWTQEKWQTVYDTSYTRPSEWLTLPALVNGDEKIVLLHKVEDHDSNFCAFIVTGNYTVNWGDGSAPQNYSSGATALKIFNYNASGIVNQTPTSQGYRQVIVTITPQAGQSLTRLDLNVLYSPSPTGVTLQQYATGWLDIRMAGQNFTRVGIGSDYVGGGSNGVNHKSLELFDYVGTLNASFTNGSYIFNNCSALRKIVNLDTSKFTNISSIFNACSSLSTIPLLDTSLASNTSFMFSFCYSLSILPFLNLQSTTNTTSMFANCSALTTVPLFNLASLTNANSMFVYCTALVSVPFFTFTSLTNADSLFRGCSALTTVPLFNLSLVTNTNYMFGGCYSLRTVPLFDLSSVTNTSNMFFTCYSLSSVPLFNLSSVITATSMFNACSTLKYIPLFNLSSLVTGDTMFQNCTNISIIPAFNLSSLTSGTNMFSGCVSESSFLATGMKGSFSVATNRLSKASLESIFNSLVAIPAAKTISVTGNWGNDNAQNIGSCVTTLGSNIVTVGNTSNLIIGMTVSGTGITTPLAIGLQTGTNKVTRTSHGLPNGKPVYFFTVVTTTGILIKAPYYVINATTNDFQISLTSGGSPIVFTGSDGTGTLYYPSYITAINPNISITMDVIASASGTITASFRFLDTSKAVGKGWTVA